MLTASLLSQVFPRGMEVKLYAPPFPPFDASIIVMLLIAVFTVTMGGFWSGAAEKWATHSSTFMHLADAFIQRDLLIPVIHVFNYVWCLGIEPMTSCAANTMLYHWATGTQNNICSRVCRWGLMNALFAKKVCLVLIWLTDKFIFYAFIREPEKLIYKTFWGEKKKVHSIIVKLNFNKLSYN